MKSLIVQAASHRYPIYIGEGILQDFSLFQQKIGKKAAIITNDVVAQWYLQPLESSLHAHGIEFFSIALPDGEIHKNNDSLQKIYDGLLTHHADRQTTILALGGGVIGDMAGFAAATYQRGIPFIQIPTTLLSQVDSSVGGKTAINHPLGKNMIGAFYQPQVVLADLSTLNTLSDKEFSSGMAEVIKYALLGDAVFLQWLERNMPALMQRQPDILAEAVAHCCQMKADIVAQDETEQNVRALLNLGHTFGHAIETEMGYGTWLHGEAVAGDTKRVKALLRQAALPDAPPAFSFDRWLAHMRHDKKVYSGKMRFVTLPQLGRAKVETIDDMDLLREVLREYTDF